MEGKKYLVYVDIMGFQNLAEKIAKEKQIEERKVRVDFLNVIRERVEAIEARKEIIGMSCGRDDWILVTSSIDLVFKILFELLDHNTGYKNYEKIPLEIAIGIGEYDKWAKFEGANLIIEGSTIKFLKTKIVEYYHKWYKESHNGQSSVSTFVIFTPLAYQELEPLDRRMCRRIEYRFGNGSGKERTVIFFVADVDQIWERSRVLRFLGTIGIPGSKLYDRINTLYVPPIEYEEIKATLETHRIVFITGTPEYGKTYTSIRLLWEYFNKGYEPKWIRGGEERQRIEAREGLEDIQRQLKKHRIIYFEDPFGKTRYERRESLEREVGAIIENVTNVNDAFVIITSREEVFKEFEKEHLSSVELEKFERTLNIKKPSYDNVKRKEILLEWAEAKECKWFNDDRSRNLVLEHIGDEANLPTPLSIRAFVIATVNVRDEGEITEEIKAKSRETARSFAQEIESMTDDKILFFSFPFISPELPAPFVKEKYQELAKELKIEKPWEFEEIIDWFKDDKITVMWGTIMFTHPSYSEAFEHLLIKKGRVTRINKEIFTKVLIKLSEDDELAAYYTTSTLEAHFDKIPESIRNELLLKLSEKELAVDNTVFTTEDELTLEDIACVIAANYGKLPPDIRNLLFKLSEKGKVVGQVAYAIERNFDRLPQEVRNELLIKLSEREEREVAATVTSIVVENFDKLPEDLRSLLFKLSQREGGAEAIGYTVGYNFDKFPKRIRNKLLLNALLSEDKFAATGFGYALEQNFDKLPERTRNRLLLRLFEKVVELSEGDEGAKNSADTAARHLASVVAKNFTKLPDNIRNILFKLSERDETAGAVAGYIAENFHELPDNARDLLFEFSKRDSVAEYVAEAIVENFYQLPDQIRNLLFELADRAGGEVAFGVAFRTIDLNFDRLPANVRNRLLVQLSEKEGIAASPVASSLRENFHKLPKKMRYELLRTLSDNDETAFEVAHTVVENFDYIPQNVRGILFKLSEKEMAAGAVAWAIAENFEKLPDSVRKLLFKLSERDEVAGEVASAIIEYFYRLPVNVRDLLFKLAKNDKVATDVARAIAREFNTLPEDVRDLLDLLNCPLQKVLGDLSNSSRDDDREQAIKLIKKVKTKLNKDFTFAMLSRLAEDKNEEVKVEAKKLMSWLCRHPPDVALGSGIAFRA
jgi:hypothetical protein